MGTRIKSWWTQSRLGLLTCRLCGIVLLYHMDHVTWSIRPIWSRFQSSMLGENLYRICCLMDLNGPPRDLLINYTAATTSWYNELYNPGYDFAQPGFSKGTGHFTQVIWNASEKLGMGHGQGTTNISFENRFSTVRTWMVNRKGWSVEPWHCNSWWWQGLHRGKVFTTR